MSLLSEFKQLTLVEAGAELVSLLVDDNATFCSSYLLKRGMPILSIEVSAKYILEYLSEEPDKLCRRFTKVSIFYQQPDFNTLVGLIPEQVIG